MTRGPLNNLCLSAGDLIYHYLSGFTLKCLRVSMDAILQELQGKRMKKDERKQSAEII